MSVLKSFLRGTIRALIRPGLSPSVPPRLARPVATLLSRSGPPVRGVVVTPTRLASMPAELLRPREGARSDVAVLYLHGGAFRIGSASMYRNLTASLAKRCRAEVFVPDYRLTPEHAFPAAHDDALAAARALIAERPGVGLVLAGDSAGGGLVLSVAQRLAADGDTRVVGCLLVSPWLDLTMSGDSARTKEANDPMLSRDGLLFAGADYLRGHPADSAAASPLFGALRGLPPMHVEVGSDEVLLDDATRLAARAREVGTEVTLVITEGIWHDFPMHAGLLAEADVALRRMGEFVDRVGRGA